MLLIVKRGVTRDEVEALIREIQRFGFRPHVSEGEETTLIGAVGSSPTPEVMEHFRSLPAVEDVVPISKPYKLASREVKPTPTVLAFPTGQTGGGHFMVAAGPCSVESREQILTAARFVKRHGAQMLRGGAFKPRTSPYAFQGLGEMGLELLAEARAETGLPVVTEVTRPDLVERVAEQADVLQVGARNAQNFALLSEVGQAGKPVLLKRGLSMTLEEFLMAAEYVLAAGNPRVILVERGIRTFERATRFTLDVSAVPVLKSWTHLPVWVDPSHAAGKRAWVLPLALAGVAAGADGLIVEAHPHPEQARSDAAQQLPEPLFATLMQRVRALRAALEPATGEATLAG
ncbi:3-deoxy-7-phosphoheptulonate synthase [Marinithermus hydrothermalis]|uniref:Phospho-2-dehydro-3-deoxyheptonate aldolase n=1 Tax=Marinithermus hydrothermalis (strain DSM 14884 / JCM 11576 / T1) TaxID=869210 RepID=F2NP86_MARHT|nr:3-deoxy-7-phosphoheptulonate synthase [Marinithermus hydrothermalis]AEB11887.1 phospho-2-dehydro-3-deoxyheptonate aldolase [Marinithermus hydrothermalis DSM 14884]